MARSVSVPTGFQKVAYAALNDDDAYDFAVDDVRYSAKERYPSLRNCNEWLGREDRAILANDLAFITISEYNGLVAIASVPETRSKKALAWCEKVDLEKLAGYCGEVLRFKGRFSNGEAIFQPVSGKQQGAMGLGFTSKEGWI